MEHENAKMQFSKSQISEIEQLIKNLESASRDKQKAIRDKLRKMGLYWNDFAKGYPYTLENFRSFVKNGTISIKDANPVPTNIRNMSNPTLEHKDDCSFVESLPPIADNASEILILGSMPGSLSLKKGEYYANPNNSFWKIISAIYNNNNPFVDYEEKLDCLSKNHIALWDMYGSCFREGSLDGDITSPRLNDIRKFLIEHQTIRKVLLNGKEAANAFDFDFPHKYVGSTSSANAKKLEEKISEWRKALMR